VPLVAALLAAALTGLPRTPAAAATETEGYLELSDGTRLRYTVVLPDGDGPFPTVLQHSGYNNGNDPSDGTFGKLTPRLVDEGFAVIGVSLRGSGCSAGTFSPFSTTWATDGVEVVGWIAG
jgi:predicted acyl esterase